MDGLEAAVIEDSVDEIDSGLEQVEEGTEEIEGAELETPEAEPEKDDPYTTRFSREMRAALKAWEQSNPEAAKFAKQARDNHARLFALQQLEPKGIDGIRERYAALEAIGGSEGLTGLQERLAGMDRVDSLLAAGDPKAFDELGPEVAGGLAKLAPAYLERVGKENPEALEAAVLPYVVRTLASSPMVTQFNESVNEVNWRMNNRDISQIPEQEIRQIATAAVKALAGVGNGLNSLGEKATQVPKVDPQRSQFEQERTQFEQERQEHHWNTRITPVVAQHEAAKFDELFKPYQTRLKLEAGAINDLKKSYAEAMKQAGRNDKAFQRQMEIYRGQKNPDPAAVANFVKNRINQHAKGAVESIVKARYSRFLSAPPKPKAAAAPVVKTGSAGPSVEIRTVKPSDAEINFKATPLHMLRQKMYVLNTGKVIQVRA